MAQCYIPECGVIAIRSIEIDGVMEPACWRHYEAHFAEMARKNCEAKGLHTTDQLRAHLKANLRPLTFGERFRQREPGEDYDEPLNV